MSSLLTLTCSLWNPFPILSLFIILWQFPHHLFVTKTDVSSNRVISTHLWQQRACYPAPADAICTESWQCQNFINMFFSMILGASAITVNICAAQILFLKTLLWDLSKKMHGKHFRKVHNTKGEQLLHVLELMHVRAITNYWFLSSWLVCGFINQMHSQFNFSEKTKGNEKTRERKFRNKKGRLRRGEITRHQWESKHSRRNTIIFISFILFPLCVYLASIHHSSGKEEIWASQKKVNSERI